VVGFMDASVITMLVRRGFSEDLKANVAVRQKSFGKPMRAMYDNQ
jgi:hypothetical protein